MLNKSEKVCKITFKGVAYILIGEYPELDPLGASITTPEQYATGDGTGSFAHVYPDGRILRHGLRIGTMSDIEVSRANQTLS